MVLGFPRSGNTFLTAWLNQVKKPQTRVIDGKVSHSALDVIRCANAGVTTLIPVREPVDTCASWLVRINQPDSQSQAIKTLKAYTAWYQTAGTQLARSSIILVPFDVFVKNPLFVTTIPEIDQFLDPVKYRSINLNEFTRDLRSALSDVHGQGLPIDGVPGEFLISLPEPSRKVENDLARMNLEKPNSAKALNSARAIYMEILKGCERN